MSSVDAQNRIPLATRAILIAADVASGRRSAKTSARYWQRVGTITGTQKRGFGLKQQAAIAAVANETKDRAQRKALGNTIKVVRSQDSVSAVLATVNKLPPEQVAFARQADFDKTKTLIIANDEIYYSNKLEAIDVAQSCWNGEQHDYIMKVYGAMQPENAYCFVYFRDSGNYEYTIPKRKKSDPGFRIEYIPAHWRLIYIIACTTT